MLKCYRSSFAKGFVCGEDDGEAVDGVAHVVGEVEVFVDCFQEVFLLALA